MRTSNPNQFAPTKKSVYLKFVRYQIAFNVHCYKRVLNSSCVVYKFEVFKHQTKEAEQNRVDLSVLAMNQFRLALQKSCIMNHD